jgi:DNA-binding transcriptional MocR family regulator
MRAARTADDLGVAPVVQEVAHGLLTSAAWPRHVRRLRTELATRRDALVDALRTTLPEARVTTVPRGGLHLWVRLDHGVDTRALAAAADAAGVLVGDGRHFYVDEQPAPHLRLSYGAASPAQIAEGVRVLGGLLRA